jgi:hypothetical protein
MIIAYQWWLLAAFVFGGPLGNWMTRRFARMAHAPRQGSALYAGLNYPYLYAWRDLALGRWRKIFEGYSPQIPMMFVYGEKKPGRFHSDRWLDLVRSRPGNLVVALDGTGHWVTKDARLKGLVRDWLGRASIN